MNFENYVNYFIITHTIFLSNLCIFYVNELYGFCEDFSEMYRKCIEYVSSSVYSRREAVQTAKPLHTAAPPLIYFQ